MQAKDVMTPEVVSVHPGDTVGEVAQTLLNHGISGAPVVDGGQVVGIVSEGDLVRRVELGTEERRRSWWLRLFTDDVTLANEYVKSHASRVGDIMTEQVISVSEDAPLADVATTLEKNRIKRVPVVRDGKLVGIISRANLVQRLAAERTHPLPPATADDAGIREQVQEILRSQRWASAAEMGVTVRDGRVELWGIYRTEEERDASRVAVERVPGVTHVEDHRVQTTTPYGYGS